LAEARARIRFADVITKEDIDEAVRLIKVATQQAATDPTTGLIDMDSLGTGTTNLSRLNIEEIMNVIKNILRDNEDMARRGVKYHSLYEDVRRKMALVKKGNTGGVNKSNYKDDYELDEFEYRDAIKQLEDQEIIGVFGSQKAPVIRLIGLK
jgi:DNA replicative helicase MCM subunit Mcm2 (Cdc46/Mcm family)